MGEVYRQAPATIGARPKPCLFKLSNCFMWIIIPNGTPIGRARQTAFLDRHFGIILSAGRCLQAGCSCLATAWGHALPRGACGPIARKGGSDLEQMRGLTQQVQCDPSQPDHPQPAQRTAAQQHAHSQSQGIGRDIRKLCRDQAGAGRNGGRNGRFARRACAGARCVFMLINPPNHGVFAPQPRPNACATPSSQALCAILLLGC